MPKKFKNYLANLLVPLPMLMPISGNASEAAFYEFVSPQQAVAEEKKDDTKTQQQNNNLQKAEASGLFLNTTKPAGSFGTLSSSMTFFTFPDKSELWLVGGQNYNQNGTNELDAGLLHTRFRSIRIVSVTRSCHPLS